MENKFYISKEQYAILLDTWKKKSNHSAAQHIVYNILRSKPIDYGFNEKKKNIQGNNPWYAFNLALRQVINLYFRFEYPLQTRTPKEDYLKRFKEDFGIDAPSDLHQKLKGGGK